MSNAMFPRQVRLLSAGDYRRVFSHADAKAQTQQILILARESFRHHQAELENFDCVVLSRGGAKDLDKAQLRDMVDQLWSRLRRKRHASPKRSKPKVGQSSKGKANRQQQASKG